MAKIRVRLLDPNSFDVHEFTDSKLRQFSSVSGELHTSERQARIGSYHFVQEDHAGIEFVDKPLGFDRIVGPRAGPEAETYIIGDDYGLIDILHTKYRRYRAKELFVIGGGRFLNVGVQQRGGGDNRDAAG